MLTQLPWAGLTTYWTPAPYELLDKFPEETLCLGVEGLRIPGHYGVRAQVPRIGYTRGRVQDDHRSAGDQGDRISVR